MWWGKSGSIFSNNQFEIYTNAYEYLLNAFFHWFYNGVITIIPSHDLRAFLYEIYAIL